MKRLLFILLGLFFSAAAFSQDKLYKKGGEVLEIKVIEVGIDEVKYKIFNDQDGPVFTIEKDRILKIVYTNGRTETYQNSLKDPELYEDQAKNAIKINFLSPLLGYTQLNFEHNLKPGRSYEVGLGIIGLGKKQQLEEIYSSGTNTYQTVYRNAGGVFVNGGYKFMTTSNYVNRGARYSHVMQGFYAKPELSFGVYGQNQVLYARNTGGNTPSRVVGKETVVFGGLIVNLGRQWILSDFLAIDLYGGLGYALDNQSQSDYDNGEQYFSENYIGNHFALMTGTDSGLGFTGGIKIGVLINKKK